MNPKIKEIKETDTHYIVRHEDGHQLKVAKKPLSKEHRDEMDGYIKMAEGGDTPEEQEDTQQVPAQDTSLAQASQDLQSMGQPGLNQPTPQPEAAQPQQSIPAEDTQGRAPASSDSLEQQQVQNIQEASKNESEANKQLVSAEEKKQQNLQDLADEYNTRLTDEDTQVQQAVKDVQDAKIDPNRYYANQSTGQKISNGIALFLGGLGAGLAGGSNPAADFIEKQINDDLMAQKEDTSKKQSLLRSAVEHRNDVRLGYNFAKAVELDRAASEVNKIIASSKSKQAVLNGQALILDLKNRSAQLKQANAQQEMLANLASKSDDPSGLVPLVVPKEHQKEVLKEIEKAQNAKKVKTDLLREFDKASDENTILKTGAGMVRTPSSVMRIKSLSLPLIHDAEGRVNEYEAKTLYDLIPQPGDTNAKVAEKRKGFQDFINQKAAAPTAKAFGIDLEKFKSTTTKPTYNPGQVIEYKGKKYTVGQDGKQLIPMKE